MSAPASALPVVSPVDVLVALHPDRGDPATDQRMLAALAAPLASASASRLPGEEPGIEAAAVDTTFAITHHCSACGSTGHGRPLLVSADGVPVPAVHLSLSRAAGWVALAATLAAPVGIDIESLSSVRTAAFDDVAFDDHERATLIAHAETHGPAAADRMRTLAWAAKEAVLKAAGTGLRADPRTVPLDLDRPDDLVALRSGSPRLVVLPGMPAGVLGCLAVVADRRPRIRVVTPSFTV
ncbi:4'-phosphopantetheinyl transferase family protein [Herbiconiux ginsengi]|uniref:4'-phosphopantetheinyl transferase n=1 Tax=Herbiconiux ginsengi TaxID=381665 RepID=A0A1H3JI86_9MICO|nr:4'-phosphopantetheinyl transferase superfamily protein [Herbiconiux ginsengi]SDY39636.1 4'-phosphopantetheinyl transferase [Herbiconiux ginsengi]